MGITPLTSLSLSQGLGSTTTSQIPSAFKSSALGIPSTFTSQIPSAYKVSSLGVPSSSQADVVTGSIPASEATILFSAIGVASTQVVVSTTMVDVMSSGATVAQRSTSTAVVVVSPSIAAPGTATATKSTGAKASRVVEEMLVSHGHAAAYSEGILLTPSRC